MEQFIKNVVENVFGFTPEIEIYNPNGNVFLVYLNGDEDQRKMMVGKMGANIITIKDLMKIYDRYNLTRTTIEVKRYDNQTNTQGDERGVGSRPFYGGMLPEDDFVSGKNPMASQFHIRRSEGE